MNKEQQDNEYQKELELLDFFDDMEYLHENFPEDYEQRTTRQTLE